MYRIRNNNKQTAINREKIETSYFTHFNGNASET